MNIIHFYYQKKNADCFSIYECVLRFCVVSTLTTQLFDEQPATWYIGSAFFLSIDVRVLWIFRFIIISVVVYFLLFHEKPFLIQFFSWADLWSSRSLFCAPLCDFLIIPSSNLCWISNAQTCVYTAWRTALYNRSQMTFSDGDISTCGIFCKLTSAPPTNTHQLYYF